MNIWKIYVPFVAALFLVGACGGGSTTTTPPSGITVPSAVSTLISDNCVRCHMGDAPATHTNSTPGGNDSDVCGICHVPYNWNVAFTHDATTVNCTAVCHSTVEGTHFFMRDDTDQTILVAGAENEGATSHGQKHGCYFCHKDNQNQAAARTALPDEGRGYPSLATDADIIASAEEGTLRSWIQEGGFMAKYLTPAEVTTITNWIDTTWTNTRTLNYDPYLDAAKITADFDINELVDSTDNAAWGGATEHVIDVIPTVYTATDTIKLKALYSNTYLYIRAEWADSTASLTRSNSWILDGAAWRHPAAATENDKQSEDRIAFFWNMSAPNFKARFGCAITCHGGQPGSSKFTNGTPPPENTLDLWHVKGARGIGLFGAMDSGLTINTAGEAYAVTGGTLKLKGVVDDKRMINFMDLAGGYDTEDSGRHGDSGGGAYANNRNAAKDGPLFMEIAPISWADAMLLTEAETLDVAQTIIADPSDAGYNAAAAATAWANYSALDALVPERILSDNTGGSRGDVISSSLWKDGVWVMEFRRKLNTGNADDVQFDPGAATPEYDFSVAVFDNCGRGEIPPGHTTYGDGQYQILRFLP